MSDLTDKLKTAGKAIGTGISWTVFPFQTIIYNKLENSLNPLNSLGAIIFGGFAGSCISALSVTGVGELLSHEAKVEKLTDNFNYTIPSNKEIVNKDINMLLSISPLAYYLGNTYPQAHYSIPYKQRFYGKDIINFDENKGYSVDTTKIELIMFYDEEKKECFAIDKPEKTSLELINQAEEIEDLKDKILELKEESKKQLLEGNYQESVDLEYKCKLKENILKEDYKHIFDISNEVKSYLEKEIYQLNADYQLRKAMIIK